MRSTPAAGTLLTGLTTLTAVAGCVAVSPETGPGARPAPGTARPVPAASGLPVAPLPGHELLATVGPTPRPPRVMPPSRAAGSGAARPDTPAADGPPPPPARTPAPRPAPARPARTAPPAATPPPPAASGGAAGDLCALAGDYGRWKPGGREAAACAEYFER
ncbi:hypothetical protein [Streptomyces sp. MAR4 CNX-425]|uniref:hypothetical protein n=1 Tax=Streptomyces sp. MAR4 CNX-425 TaxID=3406343 RepID=UPI003B50B589